MGPLDVWVTYALVFGLWVNSSRKVRSKPTATNRPLSITLLIDATPNKINNVQSSMDTTF